MNPYQVLLGKQELAVQWGKLTIINTQSLIQYDGCCNKVLMWGPKVGAKLQRADLFGGTNKGKRRKRDNLSKCFWGRGL